MPCGGYCQNIPRVPFGGASDAIHTDFGESGIALAMSSARLRIGAVRRNTMKAGVPEGVNIVITNLKPAMARGRDTHRWDCRKKQCFLFGRPSLYLRLYHIPCPSRKFAGLEGIELTRIHQAVKFGFSRIYCIVLRTRK